MATQKYNKGNTHIRKALSSFLHYQKERVSKNHITDFYSSVFFFIKYCERFEGVFKCSDLQDKHLLNYLGQKEDYLPYRLDDHVNLICIFFCWLEENGYTQGNLTGKEF